MASDFVKLKRDANIEVAVNNVSSFIRTGKDTAGSNVGERPFRAAFGILCERI